MKKSFLILLAGVLLSMNANAKSIVCYFSATGNTKALAQTTAKALNADLFEIQPEVPYTSADLNWNNSKSRTSVECKDKNNRVAIKANPDLSKYDTVILAFPIWWYTAPNIMFSFVEQNDLSGKKVCAICTSGGSGISGAEKDLKSFASKTAVWKNGARFYSSTSESELKKFFEKAL